MKFLLETYKTFFFFSFYSFMTYSIVCCCIVLILLAITTNLRRNLLWWVMSNVEVTLDDEEARWWWYGIRGRACESGWSVCDSIQKVPSVGGVCACAYSHLILSYHMLSHLSHLILSHFIISYTCSCRHFVCNNNLRESHGGGHIQDAWGLELSVTFPRDFPRDAWHLEPSVCYHKQPLPHTLPLILYHHHLASSSSKESLRCCSLLIKVSSS